MHPMGFLQSRLELVQLDLRLGEFIGQIPQMPLSLLVSCLVLKLVNERLNCDRDLLIAGIYVRGLLVNRMKVCA